LVIHSFADGIALGASSAAPSSVGVIVFAAIMVHKAPAAFGLTAALLKQGLNKRAVRTHLLLFSLAAPLGAIMTWLFIKTLAGQGFDTSDASHGQFWTGVALVFSGGTFL
jgi:zinc transporter 9